LSSLSQQFSERNESAPSLCEWAQTLTLDGHPFSFKGGHEYLEAIYRDGFCDITIEKAAQMGVSVWAILDSLHGMRFGRYPFGVMYLFPSRTFVTEFSKTKLQNIIDENDFREWFVETDAANVKKIGTSSLFLRGMTSRTGLKSVSVNKLVLDEVEEVENKLLIDLAMERVSHIENPVIHRLSVPSLPQYGIDSFFEKTDQRYWLLKCPRCNEYTCMENEFPNCLLEVGDQVIRTCIKCHSELDISQGEWVPKFPNVTDRRGYHVSQLFSKYVSPASLLQTFREGKNPTIFWNDKIGLPYVEAQNRLSVQEVLDLCGDHGISDEDQGPTFAGIDQGSRELHITIAKKGPSKVKIIYIGILKEFEEIDTLINIKRFNIARLVIDGMPETRQARALAQRHPGKIFLAFYNDHQRGFYRWNEQNWTVLVNRSESLDASGLEILNGNVVLPRESEITRLFANQLSHCAKRLITDEEDGSQRYTYFRIGGEDHFRHSWNYCVMAYQSAKTLLFPELQ
jgi:hypothetical protein